MDLNVVIEERPGPPVAENPAEDMQNEPAGHLEGGPVLQRGSVVDFLPRSNRRGHAVRLPARFDDFTR